MPIRWDDGVVAVLVARWDRAPAEGAAWLTAAAAILASHVHARLCRRLDDARCATLAPGLLGRSAAMAARAPCGGPGRPGAVRRPDPRRERSGQGAGGARRPRHEPPPHAADVRRELRGAARRPARVRALRLRPRRVHRRRRRPRRPVRGRARRDAVPGRSGGLVGAGAGEAAARVAATGGAAARGVADAPDRRAHRQRRQPGSARGGDRRHVPARSGLPSRRHPDLGAAPS